MVRSGRSPSARPTSPNWRSTSTTVTLAPCSARLAERLEAVSVFPIPPFGPSTQISRPPSVGRRRGPGPARDGLLENERQVLRQLVGAPPILVRQPYEVVGPGLEDACDVAVLRSAGKDHDWPPGPAITRAPDESHSFLGRLGAGHDEHVRGRVLQRVGLVLQPVDEAQDLELLARQRRLDGMPRRPWRRARLPR